MTIKEIRVRRLLKDAERRVAIASALAEQLREACDACENNVLLAMTLLECESPKS